MLENRAGLVDTYGVLNYALLASEMLNMTEQPTMKVYLKQSCLTGMLQYNVI